MIKITFINGLFTAAVAIGVSPCWGAGIIASLDNPTQTGAAGDTLIFNVTLTNTSATDQIWLNGIGSTAVSPFLGIDISPFDVNAPLFLDPLESSGSFELFDVVIGAGTPDGPYVGSFVSIQGGADGGAGSAFDDLVDVRFDVNAQSPGSAAPEPATLGMLCVAGLTALGWRRRQERG